MKKRSVIDFSNPNWKPVDPEQLRQFEEAVAEKVVKSVNARAAKQRDYVVKARTRLVR